ncbi:hypothetical protein SAMD00019534_046310 [Acytostelium subglobosum LB1]|uniref:hypothetical protein n=1 Tax=Acytostelium subglobosum LB1 TaxID=1410327 RepID=UPI000644F652|nr:hypothetical protein SAMD00019534_046310 [Acytostelium subglobosum LB1]GAM21456.1 hypothetical protein SAMD00019534_046310 [Acytostelium subglobosum LB1]|eukprot:XP_012755575.1 hypothetical protein SAMD00019534_046310 [Acytostelium subglobosum LB1]
MSVELAINYATLILHDAQAPITAESIIALAGAAGVKVPTHVAQLYVATFAKKSVDSILTVNVAAAAAPAAAAAAAPAAAAAKKEAPKKEEKKEESDDDMGMGLFD